MPVFEITAPDGRVFEVEGPEGSTAEQALAQVQAQYQPKTPPAGAKTAMRLGRAFLQGGPLGLAATGVGEAMENIDQAADVAGGATTDVVAKVAPPEVAAATGTAVKMLPTLIGGSVAKAAGKPLMEKGAKTLMHSALKPNSQAIVSGDAAKAIDTMLKEGANVSTAGAAKLRRLVNQLHGEVASKIDDAAKAGATVDKGYVGSQLYETLQKFRNQVNPGADTAAIMKSWDEFNKLAAAKIPVAEAQSLKQGTYRILADKYAKGGVPAIENEASTQAQMAMARGLREGVEDAVPGVGALNARESAIINALELAEKRAGIAGNRDVAGIAWLANHPAAAAAMLADRSPAFKSALANLMHRLRGGAPFAAGAGATAGYIQGNEEEGRP